MRWCPTVRRCRRCNAGARSTAQRRCGRGDATAGGGSMKSQFKRADASGARFALIFGPDELAAGQVALIKPLRGPKPRPEQRHSRPLSQAASWAHGTAQRHNLGCSSPLTPSWPAPLDLQEQEQLDALKAFWNQYGNLITWVLTLAMLGAYAAWNGWNWWQREQARRPARCTTNSNAWRRQGDADKTQGRIFADLKSASSRRHHVQRSRAALLAAKVQVEKQPARCRARRRLSLGGRATPCAGRVLQAIARLRAGGPAAGQANSPTRR